jgi:hypothetical protein
MAKRRAKNNAPDVRVNQSERFIEAARKAGCSEDEAVFDENLRKIARHKPPDAPIESKKAKAKKPGRRA